MNEAPLVVHVIYRLATGGLENGLVNLVNRLPRDAWRHLIVALEDVDRNFARRIVREDVRVLELHKGPGHLARLYPVLHRLFRRERPAIVHTRNLAALEALLPAWSARVPARLHGEHGWDAADPQGRNAGRRRLRRLFRPFVQRYVALSPDLARYLVEAIGVPATRVEQVYNGVDTQRFVPAAGDRPAIAGCPFGASHRLIGTVGRLDPVKGHVDLVQAFVRVARDDVRLRLVIVGEGSERARVEANLRAAGVFDRAWLPGLRDDVPEVLRGLDVFVLPSHGEGVSNTILEAMATGLPVVATAVGANRELVAEGSSGRVVPPSAPEALAAAVAMYAADPALACAHGRNGRLRAEQQFSLDRMVDRYHRLYLDALGASRGRVGGSLPARPTVPH